MVQAKSFFDLKKRSLSERSEAREVMNSRPIFRTGAAYYPDYVPAQSRIMKGMPVVVGRAERLALDFERMKRCGLSWIRMGEFSWSTVEPSRGSFNPDVFLEALDLAHKHQIDVIFCTPTATPPPWLTAELPEILPVDRGGRVVPPGSRRHYDPTNAAYRSESRRITEYYARTFGGHKAVRMWQTDNEFGCHGSTYVFTDSARAFFHAWLQTRYANIEALNESWQTAFWSQGYRDFSEVPMPLLTYADQNPGLELDFRRAMNEAWKIFQADQIAILREHSPGRSVTHNFMTLFFELDPWLLSGDLDVAGFDHYQMETEPHPRTSAWQFRLMASLKNRPFMVLEQQPVQVNWQKVNRRFDLNWLFVWGMQSLFAGADSMLYFSWQRMYGGAEQYHDGIVPHDIRVQKSEQEELLEFQDKFLAELKSRGIESLRPVVDVCIVLDFESVWSHEITSQSEIFTSRRAVDFAADLCLTSGLGFSFAPSIAQADLSAKILILPSHAFELTDIERTLLRDYVEKGGVLITLPRSLMKRRDNRMSDLPLYVLAPDDLLMRSYGALLADEQEKIKTGTDWFKGWLWAENIVAGPRIRSEAHFKGGLYAGAPAVMRQTNGNGSWIHLAVLPELNAKCFRWLLKLACVAPRVEAESGTQVFPLQASDKMILGVVQPGAPAELNVHDKRERITGVFPGELQSKSPRRKHRLPGGSVSVLI